MNAGSFFSGAGLLDCGLAMAGLDHAWGCESDEWRRELWSRRFNAPCYPDIRVLRGAEIEPVDVLAGGFPCRGVSTAGKRSGFEHPETALWSEFARLVRELRPRYVVVENVAALLGLKDGAIFGTVVGDLAACGFDIWWDCLPACAFSAPHRQDRVFIVAYSASERLERRPESVGTAGAQGSGGDSHPSPTADAGGQRRQQVPRGPSSNEGPTPRRREDADHVAASAGEGWVQAADFPWNEYEPAIRRWEYTLGRNAPPPLTGAHGMDDGNPTLQRVRRRVDKSRMSAHGDGVLVQAGAMIGAMIVAHEREIAAPLSGGDGS